MKMYKQRGLLAALLVTAMACSTMLRAQDTNKAGSSEKAPRKGRGGPSVEQRMERMTKELDLTDDQKPKVKTVLEDSQKKMQEMRNDSTIAQSDRREKFTELRKEEDKKLKEILTADQYTKYEKLRDEMRKKGGPGGEGKKKKKQDA